MEQYNRVIRTEPFSYRDALKLAHRLVKAHADDLDRADIHHQGLSMDYKLTLLALEEIWLHGTHKQ